jgi:alpha-amylase
MTKGISLYLHVHQPYRVRQYSVFDIGNDHSYFGQLDDSDLNNEKVFHKVADKSYRPMTTLLQKLLDENPEFRLSLSITGIFIEQAERWAPDVLDVFKGLVSTGRVELVSETYYHSLAFFYSREEFEVQVNLHKQKLQQVFGVTPTAFRNTELAYNNELAKWAEEAGYQTILAEGWDPVLEGKSPNYVYRPQGTDTIKLLLKNYKLSDDIAFRFGNRTWSEWPLTPDKYTSWINGSLEHGTTANLFMDFETFGEHQWSDTDIFGFFERFVGAWLSDGGKFYTVSEAAATSEAVGEISMPNTVTWADSERDLSAWIGNSLQSEAFRSLYAVESDVTRSGDESLIRDWRYLQSSDLMYYMATKWEHDGDVHSYFSPYDSPFDAFLYYMNTVRDVRYRIMEHHKLGGLGG